jgi:hypothetical protein
MQAWPQGYAPVGYGITPVAAQAPQGQAAQQLGSYEFNAAENAVIGRAGSRIATWGIIQAVCGSLGIAGGLLGLLQGVFALAQGNGGPMVSAVVLLAESGIFLFISLLILRAGGALKRVVHTQGNDVPLLMDALTRLGKAFFTQTILFLVGLGFAVLMGVLALIFLAGAFANFAGHQAGS